MCQSDYCLPVKTNCLNTSLSIIDVVKAFSAEVKAKVKLLPYKKRKMGCFILAFQNYHTITNISIISVKNQTDKSNPPKTAPPISKRYLTTRRFPCTTSLPHHTGYTTHTGIEASISKPRTCQYIHPKNLKKNCLVITCKPDCALLPLLMNNKREKRDPKPVQWL